MSFRIRMHYPITKRHKHLLFEAFLMPFCIGIYNSLWGFGFWGCLHIHFRPSSQEARTWEAPGFQSSVWLKDAQGPIFHLLTQPHLRNAFVCVQSTIGGAWSAYALMWSLETRTPVGLLNVWLGQEEPRGSRYPETTAEETGGTGKVPNLGREGLKEEEGFHGQACQGGRSSGPHLAQNKG